MKLLLQREPSTKKSTAGKLFIDGVFECYTLEDSVRARGVKVYGQTAIPAGTYQVLLTQSPRFKRVLPLLLNVPGFEGIRIHPGNKAEDTDGCILVGDAPAPDWLGQSKVAFDRLFTKLRLTTEPVTIEIREAQ
ncbi:hypothetical protein I5R65_07775 [Herbaspirillum sp. AP02]|uniref:DUF5675 family protein n=1 Tax=unclassified Herbaspirillum TaxID=2624150 RepID=UPI0015DA7B31|nr:MULTISPECIES: DUF5675 family protein [unclassified Herbaspirillum]MBG7619359.1 hypothetical protein [Herbaspirillum sp. AP02]NZD66643.1 hypothetical protein [Herbaspirillum sp. AP21]